MGIETLKKLSRLNKAEILLLDFYDWLINENENGRDTPHEYYYFIYWSIHKLKTIGLDYKDYPRKTNERNYVQNYLRIKNKIGDLEPLKSMTSMSKIETKIFGNKFQIIINTPSI